jgi:predicted aldo/keto reductase-like oxidoreductase
MARSEDTVSAAFDAGINFFFLSSDLHWPYYDLARRGLEKLLARSPGIREQIVVAMTSYVTQPEFCAGALEEGLNAVAGLMSIDLAIIGGAYSHEFLTRVNLYHYILAQGNLGIKATGTTFHDRMAALLATNHNLVDIAFIRYNPIHTGARLDLFPHLKQPTQTLLYNFKSTLGALEPERYAELGLNDDYWQPNVTDYYRFALTRPEIDGLLCSPSTPQEVEALVSALEEGPLDEEEEKYLIDLSTLDQGGGVLMPNVDGKS